MEFNERPILANYQILAERRDRAVVIALEDAVVPLSAGREDLDQERRVEQDVDRVVRKTGLPTYNRQIGVCVEAALFDEDAEIRYDSGFRRTSRTFDRGSIRSSSPPAARFLDILGASAGVSAGSTYFAPRIPLYPYVNHYYWFFQIPRPGPKLNPCNKCWLSRCIWGGRWPWFVRWRR